jgi:integrase/recombinase XerD
MASFLRRHQSAHGLRTMGACLKRLSHWCGVSLADWEPHLLGVIGVNALVHKIRSSRTKSGKPWSAAYIAAHEAALAGVLDQCWAVGLLDHESLQRLKYWKRIRVRRDRFHQAAGRMISDQEKKGAWEAASSLGTTSSARSRDLVFLSLLFCGLRREECVQVQLDQILDGNRILLRGKGDRERLVLLDGWMRDALTGWLENRGLSDGPLLCPVNKQGEVRAEEWSLTGASKRFREILKKAGIRGLTPHDFRRTFASDALRAGVDINLVARWMGHADVRTTMSYDRRGVQELTGVLASIRRPF